MGKITRARRAPLWWEKRDQKKFKTGGRTNRFPPLCSFAQGVGAGSSRKRDVVLRKKHYSITLPRVKVVGEKSSRLAK